MINIRLLPQPLHDSDNTKINRKQPKLPKNYTPNTQSQPMENTQEHFQGPKTEVLRAQSSHQD